MEKRSITTLVIAPLLQALITGMFTGLAAGLIARLVNYPKFFTLALVVAALAAWFAWLAGIDRALPKPEKPQKDENRYETVRVNVIQEDNRAGLYIDLPLSKNRLIPVCQALADGTDFSLSSLGGRGKLLTRSEFESLRDVFVKRGLAYWVNPASHNQGAQLTAAGRAIVRRFASPAEF